MLLLLLTYCHVFRFLISGLVRVNDHSEEEAAKLLTKRLHVLYRDTQGPSSGNAPVTGTLPELTSRA